MSTYPRRDIITGALAVAGVVAILAYDKLLGDDDTGELRATGLSSQPEPTQQAEPTPQPTTTSPATTSPAPSERETAIETEPPVEETTTPVSTFSVPVICRDAWGANPPGPGMIEHTVSRLTIHHTAVAVNRVADGPSSILSHQRFHQAEKKWPDIAYHFLIDPGGNVYQGRDPIFGGDTATNYEPAGHFLVCIDGNFDEATVNEAQRGAAARVLAWAAHQFDVDPATLAGHRDFADTSCPGDAIYAMLTDGSLLAEVQALLGSGVPQLQLTCGPEGDALIDAIEASEA